MGMERECDLELDKLTIERAYIAFEAMVDHDYNFCCVRCGHHPPILVYDVTRKALFDYDGELNDLPKYPCTGITLMVKYAVHDSLYAPYICI